jgi:Xaa-Pro aminopeptidase
MKHILTLAFLTYLSAHTWLIAQDFPRPLILPMRERAIVEDRILEERIKDVLPVLMRRENIDLWLIIGEEYNEDPVLKTMLPATWLSARRKTVLLIYDPGAGKALETLAVARYNVGKMFKGVWNPEKEPDQWKRIIELIEERKPQRIAVNTSEHFAHADGLSHTEYENLYRRLPVTYQKRLVSGEKLAVGWLETRTPNELVIYEQICRLAHQIIADGFSEKVIQPGITTTDDVVWWYRERISELGLVAWFHPTVDVQRPDPDNKENERSFASRPDGETIIMPGDVVHVDFGITYLRLNTDTQQLAYILKPGETDAPEYLKKALSIGNRLQDILTEEFKLGRTGNQILKSTRERAIAEGITPSIYTHPIGYHGHGAGPAVGMWDAQGGVPGTGDYPLYHYTAYAIELNAQVSIPEWNNKVFRVMLEQNAVFTPQGVHYMGGRQKEFLLVPRQVPHLKQ